MWFVLMCQLIQIWCPSQQTKLRHQYCCPGGPDRIKVQQSPGLEEPLFQVSWSLDPSNAPGSEWDHLMVEVGSAVCLSNIRCVYVFAGTQAPPQTPLLAHTTPPHPRTCGTRVRPTAWVRGWLYQVNTHINTSRWNTSSMCLQGAPSFTFSIC